MDRCLVLIPLVFACLVSTAAAAPPELDWETANARRMFVVANDEHRIAAIVADTTHVDELRASSRLQELVYRLSGARLPIVDREFMAVPWGHIHLRWDHHPMAPRRRPFTIEMKHFDTTSANPAKQIIIAGSPPATPEEAVSAFAEAAFGMPLVAIDDKSFKWERRNTLAVPEDFGRQPAGAK